MVRVRQVPLLVTSLILLAVILCFAVQRLVFLSSALHTTGTVTNVSAQNTTCGGGRRRRSYPCTRYQASIQFFAEDGAAHTYRVGSGSSRNHGRPISESRLKLWESVPVVYSPTHPERAYEDTFMGVWGLPFMLFIFQIMTFISSFLRRRGEVDLIND